MDALATAAKASSALFACLARFISSLLIESATLAGRKPTPPSGLTMYRAIAVSLGSIPLMNKSHILLNVLAIQDGLGSSLNTRHQAKPN